MTDKNTIWNQAGRAGLVLGGVSILYLALSTLASKLGTSNTVVAFLISLLNLMLWAAKFIGCLMLMKMFLKSFSDSDPDADNGNVFAFGVRVAFLSALFYSTAWLAYVLWIDPDVFSTALDTFVSSAGNKLDSNTLQAIENAEGSFPTVGFATNLIYCTLFGTIVAAFQSRNIPPRNPFEQQ